MIGRSMVPGHARQQKFARLHYNGKNMGVEACASHLSKVEKYKIGN
jgi:hypothetical protein